MSDELELFASPTTSAAGTEVIPAARTVFVDFVARLVQDGLPRYDQPQIGKAS